MARLLADSHAQLAHAFALQVQQDAQRYARIFQHQNDIASARGDGWTQRTCLRDWGTVLTGKKLSLSWDRRPK